MSDFNSLVQYTVENISRPVKYIIYKLTEFIRVVDKFVFRQVPSGAASGYATIEQIEGNTVAWNQLVDTSDTSCTVPNGHKYYSIIGGTKSISTSDGTSFAVTGGTDVVIDLTQMFGAGNEPTTVADFEAWLAQNIGTLPYYDYNAGELMSVKMSGIQTEDSSQQTLDTLPFDVTTITGINTSTNVREVIFPQGMKKVGDVEDIINLMDGTATVKCRIKDLGTINYGTFGSHGFYATAVNSEIRKPTSNNEIATWLITPLTSSYKSGNSLYGNEDFICIGVLTNGQLRINHPSYSNPTTFKTAMNGVELIYELATPITYTDLQDANGNPLNPRYKVEQGGTEQVLPVNTSTPTTVAPTLTTTYTKDNN